MTFDAVEEFKAVPLNPSLYDWIDYRVARIIAFFVHEAELVLENVI